MAAHNELGKWGEEQAALYLQQKGYSIQQRDWRLGHRDIDIIAITPEGKTLVFVEVKTRSYDFVKHPFEAIDRKKMHNLFVAADAFIKYYRITLEWRFDIIGITGTPNSFRIEHMEAALHPMKDYGWGRKRY